jgi:cell wall-associated NlpC family hydrolase
VLSASGESNDFKDEMINKAEECSNEFVSPEELKRTARSGDLIECRRWLSWLDILGYFYNHWGIYVGNVEVVHATGSGQNFR